MNVTVTVVSVLAIAVLIFGNAVFVAAEFSLTALDRSTVEANARKGGRRDRLIQRHANFARRLSCYVRWRMRALNTIGNRRR